MRASLRYSSALLGILLASCTSKDAPSASGSTGGTVVMAVAGDANALFPPLVEDGTGRLVMDQVFDRLAEIDDKLVTVGDKGFTPRLAQKWTWTPDSLSIAFSIDPRARWHDGKPVTADDVRFSLKVFTDPRVASITAPSLANIDSISVRDSLTAVVWFKKRTPEQFYDLAYQLVIVPEHVYGAIPLDQLRTSDQARKLVGSGRFRFVRWDAGQRIELIADTSNFRGRAKLDRVIVTPVDAPTAATQLLAGQVDFVEGFPIDQVPRLDSSAIARPVLYPNLGYAFMGFNPHDPKVKGAPHPIFSDIRVRRALSMAVDRNGMLRNVFGPSGHIGHGPFAMTAPFADSAVAVPPYDTVAAKAMLDSAGWRVGPDGIRAKNGKPFRFTLLGTTTSLFRMRYSVLLQEQFRKLGVRVDIDQNDGKTFAERMKKGEFDVIMGSWSPDPNPSGIKQFWGSSSIGPNGLNVTSYSNPKVDALLDSASASFDPAKMKSYASHASQLIVADVPAIWLYDIQFVDGVNRRITLAPMRADAAFSHLADWSIPADKRIDRDRIGLAQPKP
jgi:peptide/nickel transport system substrate-binding protein